MYTLGIQEDQVVTQWCFAILMFVIKMLMVFSNKYVQGVYVDGIVKRL